MPEKSVWEILLDAVKKQLKEVEEIRVKVSMGSENETKLTEAYDLFNTIVVTFLKSDLNKVAIQRAPRKTQQHLLVVAVPSDGFTFRIPIEKIDGDLKKRVDEKMNTIQIVEGKVMSLRNPAQPMTWEEVKGLPYPVQDELTGVILETLGVEKKYPLDFFVKYTFRKLLPLEEMVIVPDALMENFARAAKLLIAQFKAPEAHTPKEFVDVYLAELKRFVEARRADRVPCEVQIKAGTTKWGRFAYGIDVVAPDGRRFSVVNSGSLNDERWEPPYSGDGSVWSRNMYIAPQEGEERGRYEKGTLNAPDFVLFIAGVPAFDEDGRPKMGLGGFSPVDLEGLPEENGYWRWMIYLPSKDWRVIGGSTSFLDRPIESRAVVKCAC